MNRSLSVLVYGQSKAGKSTLAITCPAPRVLLDVESAARFLPIKAVSWDPATAKPPEPDGTWDTAVVATRDWSTVDRVYAWLNSGQHPFKSLIIDSISELQNRYIESVAGRNQLTQQQWGSAFREVGGLARDIRDLTMHPTRPLDCVVMTAMMKEIKDKFRPWCQGQLQALLPYLMDACLYLYTDTEVDPVTGEGKEVRRLLTRSTSEFEAGERVGGAWPSIITAPNISNMIDDIFGAVDISSTTTEGSDSVVA